MFTKILTIISIIGVILAVGYAGAAGNPEKIETSAMVMDNAYPAGTESYRTWNLVLTDATGRQIVAQEQGFNPATMVSAYYLAEAARKAGEPLTVTGEMKTLPTGETVLALDSIIYGGCTIDTDAGPFVEDYGDDVYPGSPLFYGGQTFYPGEMPY